ncbi:hypothetical protein ASF00_06990 [Sphingomonas sp. Leaf34]|nr:hypothetical protein ASF00_06990 [Sphingomonas sp. Leaf34]
MTKRVFVWRSAGVMLGLAAGVTAITVEDSSLVVLLLPLVLIGLTLMINGKRVAIAFQAERRGHWHTAEVIHAERLRRHRRRIS